jgi:porin
MSEQVVMKVIKLFIALVLLQSSFLAVELQAADAPSPTPYSGDIWTRSTLSGDWGGLRNELAAKGVTLDMNITQVGQGVVGGGKNGAWEYGGRGDLILNLDSGKLGLWPGGFFNFEMEGNWASAVNPKTGALMPVNVSQTVPLPPGGIFGVPAWNFTQFLSPYAGLTIGKFATVTDTSGDMNEFAHGKGDTNFMNMAFNFNPLIAFTVPYSTLGTGVGQRKSHHLGLWRFERQCHHGCRRGSGENGLFRFHGAPEFRHDVFQQKVYIDRSEVRQGHDREQRAQG